MAEAEQSVKTAKNWPPTALFGQAGPMPSNQRTQRLDALLGTSWVWDDEDDDEHDAGPAAREHERDPGPGAR